MGNGGVDIHIDGIGAGHFDDGDLVGTGNETIQPVGRDRPVAAGRVDPAPLGGWPDGEGHQRRLAGLETIGGPVGETRGPYKSRGRGIGQAVYPIRGHAARACRRLLEAGKRHGVAIRIGVVAQRVDGQRDPLQRFRRVRRAARGAIRVGHAAVVTHQQLGEHPVAMADPARPVVRQRGMFEEFQAEAGHRAADAVGPNRVGGGGGHIASDEDRAIRQHGQGFAAGAGHFHHLEHRPVRRDVAANGETIGEGAAIRRGGREPETADKMRTAKRLRQGEREDGRSRDPQILLALKHRGHGRRAANVTRPAGRTGGDAVDQLAHREAALAVAGGGVLQDNPRRRRYHDHRLANRVQLCHARSAAHDRSIEFRAELGTNERGHRDLRPQFAEVGIGRRPVSRQQREGFRSGHPAEQPQRAEAMRGRNRAVVIRKKLGGGDFHGGRRFPLEEMRETRRLAIGEGRRRAGAIERASRRRRHGRTRGDDHPGAGIPHIVRHRDKGT